MVAQSILGPARWLSIFALLGTLGACGGGGGGGQSSLQPNPQNPGGPTPTDVTISGKITFDRIPFKTAPGTGLNPNAPVESPARGIVVEAISGNSTIASTITDSSGNYSVTVPSNTTVTIRAKAQMLKSDVAPTWNFRVLNNANSDALYALDSAAANSGSANSTRNLKASSGWTGTSYGATRAAAPFAILDTVYAAKELVRTASASAVFPPLSLFWSVDNRPAPLCPDSGQIGTTFFTEGTDPDSSCPGQVVDEGIYLLGNFDSATSDTDEFDQHVIAHEFGHYLEAKFSRTDSIGGNHSGGNKLDLRVAFSEGWGNAFSGIVLGDPFYRDSQQRVSNEFNFDMEDDVAGDGWYSESSVQEILWDVFDPANEANDAVVLGFGPIFNAIVGLRTTDAFTSIYSFLSALRTNNSSVGSDIDQLRTSEQIFGTDAFAAGETNNGGDIIVGSDLGAVPVYRPIAPNDGPHTVCVKTTNGTGNKLGNHRFFRLDLASNATGLTFTAMGAADGANPSSAAAGDPDIFVVRRGSIVAAGFVETTQTQTISNVPLNAGTYIIDLLAAAATDTGTRCMTFSITGS